MVERKTKNSIQDSFMAGVYIVLSFLSFLCACYELPVGVKYIVNLLITGWAVLAFLIKPNFQDGTFCLKFFCLNYAPYFISWLWSLLLWMFQFQTIPYILRGSKNMIYMFTTFAYTSAAVYLFGSKSLAYTFSAMVAANAVVIMKVGLANGFGELLSEYATLVTSFAENTGQIVRKLELHDMVYGWGPFLIYFLFDQEMTKGKRFAGVVLSLFYFSLALKRIGVFAVALSCIVGFLYGEIKEKGKKRMITVGAFLACVLIWNYICAIHSGLFYDIADQWGINLMSRDRIYSTYSDFYELSPTFLGQGSRFVKAYGTENPNSFDALHNVFLENYIEMGFWCWMFWLFYELLYRVRWIGKKFSWQAAGWIVMMTVYVFITYLTDNTFYHFPINVTYPMIVMVECLKVEKRSYCCKEKA